MKKIAKRNAGKLRLVSERVLTLVSGSTLPNSYSDNWAVCFSLPQVCTTNYSVYDCNSNYNCTRSGSC